MSVIDRNQLGCQAPIVHHGKPMKYLMTPLAMVDANAGKRLLKGIQYEQKE
jgi:hypothetical protein